VQGPAIKGSRRIAGARDKSDVTLQCQANKQILECFQPTDIRIVLIQYLQGRLFGIHPNW
ncbi:MAG TPA: hypothetical protein VF913_11510, partial [Xanthobacteraceae bacterium]